MPGVVIILLTSVTVAWLFMRHYVQRKLRVLDAELPTLYQSAIVAPPDSQMPGRLIPLAVDLIRKEQTLAPLDALRPAERRVAVLALGIERLPRWMINLAKQRLSSADRQLVTTLQQIHTSKPEQKVRHFGAIQAELRLRAARKA